MFFGEEVRVMLVSDRHKHAGITSRSDGKMSTDVAMKMAAIREGAKAVKRAVLANRPISREARIGVVNTHVISKGDLGAARGRS